MKESEAKNKLCQMGIGNGFCQGSMCMAWEPDHKRETKETMEAVALNKGDEVGGWFVERIRASDLCTAWVRYIPLDSGDCGMKSKEHGCWYPG